MKVLLQATTLNPLLLDFSFFNTHPGVSSLLEFLCNGLVRGHDDKHLDGHVKDCHGDQVGHVVSVGKGMHKYVVKSVYTASTWGYKGYQDIDIHLHCTVERGCVHTVPVSLAVVQSAAGPEGLIVVHPPANEGHGRPEGGEEPDKYHQGDGAAPLQLCP